MSAPSATAVFRPTRRDVLVSFAANGVDFASLPLPVATAAQLYQDLAIALSVAGPHEINEPVSSKVEYNRTDAAREVLTEIDAWCARTGTREGTIGHVLFLHPGFVGLLRKRLTISVEKEAAVRAFLRDHPHGYAGDLPPTHGNGTKPVRVGPSVRGLSEVEISARRVYREACPRCGVRLGTVL
jgi:hypothetical protein